MACVVVGGGMTSPDVLDGVGGAQDEFGEQAPDLR
jgi:hypothetical protein